MLDSGINMKLKNLLAISLIFLILTIGVVSASDEFTSDDLGNDLDDVNGIGSSIDDMDIIQEEDAGTPDSPDQDSSDGDVSGDDSLEDETPDPEMPVISISSAKIKSGQSIDIYLKAQNGTPLSNRELVATINKNAKNLTVDSQGKASLKLDLNAGTYSLNVKFKGNENYTSLNRNFNVTVLKVKSIISPIKNSIVKGNYFYAYLKDQNGNLLAGKKLNFKVKGKTYTATTNNKGKAGFKVSFNIGKYSLKITYGGDAKHNSVSKTMNLYVPSTTKLVIGNTRLLTNGYLRIYLKSDNKSVISKKRIHITVNNKKFNRTTNKEGIVIFKPKAGTGSLNVSAKFEGVSVAAPSSKKKTVKGVKGNVKSPFKYKIPLRNGMPDIDVMPGNYVLADGSMTYTLNRSQYLSVIKRDSYCLFLNNKLSQYTFFKSKKEPNLQHIISRKKWNVIERALNTKLVKKNKIGYWPSQITVSLKGKSYTYSEVRDMQDTTFSCGPTSSSMCTQALRNYICESYLIKLSGARKNYGSSPTGLARALEKNHYKCTSYQKRSLNKALNELKKGGCALVFHTWGHYVAIVDISKDGKKVLVSNSRGGYSSNSDRLPTNWVSTKFVKTRFADDTPGLIVRLNYSLSKKTKKNVNNFYSSMGTKWTRQNTAARIPQI